MHTKKRLGLAIKNVEGYLIAINLQESPSWKEIKETLEKIDRIKILVDEKRFRTNDIKLLRESIKEIIK